MTSVIPTEMEWHRSSDELHPYYVADVFTPTPLQGNQLGVFIDGRPFSDREMQRLAKEMNFAETVFLLPPKESGDVWVRIFTPGAELPFAGHPVLGTAFIVATALDKDAVTLETGAGLVPISLERKDGEITFGRMQQPIPASERFEKKDELLRALGVEQSELPVELYRNGPPHVYVKLSSRDAVRALKPDMAALSDLGVASNCFAGEGASWETRMFFPAAGVPEDPATGSAAGPLAIHLARHGEIAFGEEIEIKQGLQIGRPSVLYARATGTAERIESVEVGGMAIIVANGLFRIKLT